jgi:hypothetical protein
MTRNPNDITAYRRKRERKSKLYMSLSIILLTFGIFFIWTSGDIFESARELVSNIASSDSGGFPIMLSGSASYSLNRLGPNFTLLSDTYLYTYNERGGEVFSFRHNYTRPIARVSDRRILVYNFNSGEFSLFSRNGRNFENKLDDRIILAEIGGNDSVAIVTTSATFSNILYIYDSNGNFRYRRRFVDEEVNAVTFTSKNNEILVATSTLQRGVLVSKIYRLRTDREDDIIWEAVMPGDALVLKLHENGNFISALADNMMLSVDTNTGAIDGWYEFRAGRLLMPVFGDNYNLVVLSDYVTGRTLYLTLDERSNLISTQNMPFEVKRVEIYDNIVYTLTGDSLFLHDRFLNAAGRVEFEEEYRDFIRAGNYTLLLGYEAIEQAALNF